MQPTLYQLDSDILIFPPAQHALTDPDGLLAIGGDLTPERLIKAYQSGIFPWFGEDEPIMWWSPAQRGVLFFDQFYINRSFKKFLRKNPFRMSVNLAFDDVIENCRHVYRANSPGTWITEEMVAGYKQLHRRGQAHSVEVWLEDTLVGGLYGVMAGSCFCGESMFHIEPYASRVAYHALVQHLQAHGGDFIDCQMQNDFLKTLGVSEISRELYLKKLASSLNKPMAANTWQPRYLD